MDKIFNANSNNKENLRYNSLGLDHVIYSSKDPLPLPCSFMFSNSKPEFHVTKMDKCSNLNQYFEESATFEKGLINLRNHKGDFEFTFNSDFEDLSQNPLKLQQDLEMCRKVQYEILRKLKHFKVFKQRGMLCIQNTSISVDKEKYWFAHHEQPRKIVQNA